MPLTHLQIAQALTLVTVIYFSFWYRYRPLGLEAIYRQTKEENDLLITERSVESGFTVRNRSFIYTFHCPCPSDDEAAAELVVEYVKKRLFQKKVALTAEFIGGHPVRFKLADDEVFLFGTGAQRYIIKGILMMVSELPEMERLRRAARSAQAANRQW